MDYLDAVVEATGEHDSALREILQEDHSQVPTATDTYLFDSWFAHDSALVEHIESYGND